MRELGGQYFFLTVFMIISNVQGRWLEISDGVHDINDMNQKNDSFLRMSVSDLDPTTLSAEGKRCKSIYGFLPCADTVPEGIFLILMYTYALMLGEECLKKGSAALLIHFRRQHIAGSVFRVLMALPRVVMVIVSGVLSTQSDARNQVAFGFAMYAGSTVISLTGLWGVYVIMNTEKLTKSSDPTSSKLSHFKDVGVIIDNDTCNMASILLLSLIPFAAVLLLLVFSDRIIVLLALILSVLSFCYYIGYQFKHPRIQAKSVAYLKEEEFQQKFLLKLKGPNNESVYTNTGHPDIQVIRSIFKSRDADDDGKLKRSELANFIRDTFDNEEECIFRQYALDEILGHFDKDSTQSLTMMEFEEGCTSLLNKWSVANKGLDLQKLKHPRIQTKSVTYSKEEEFQQKFLLKLKGPKNESVYTNTGHPDIEVIRSIFKSRDADDDGKLKRSELENFIRDTIDNEEERIFRQYALDEILRHFDKDSTQSLTMTEFEEGCTSWLNKWSVAIKGLGLQKFVADNKLDKLAIIPKYLYEPLINSLTTKENGVIAEKIEKLFSHDEDNNGEMNYEELEKAIVELKITEQDAGAFAKSMIAALDTNETGTLNKEEIITGLENLTAMANTRASGHNDLVTLFQRYVCEMLGLVNDKEGFDWNILYILLGAGTLYLFAGPFMQSVIQFSSALQIPFLFTSFVVAPFFMNARSMVIYAFSFSSKKNTNRSGSLKFFELYSGLIMNNLMGLITLLAIVYAKDLTWSYTPEVVTIIAIGLIMGTFARSCKTYPLWTSVLSFLLYITTIIIFCVYAWERV